MVLKHILVICLFLMAGCKNAAETPTSSEPLPSYVPNNIKKNNEAPDQQKDVEPDGNEPGPGQEPGDCCHAYLASLDFDVSMQELANAGSAQEPMDASVVLGVGALDHLEGMDLHVGAQMMGKTDTHSFSVRRSGARSFDIDDLYFPYSGTWWVTFSFLDKDDQTLLDQASMRVVVP